MRFEDGTGGGLHPTVSVEDHYRLQYYEALDGTIAGIKNRFNQPGYIMYKSVENWDSFRDNCPTVKML